jgi:hypothetical protein
MKVITVFRISFAVFKAMYNAIDILHMGCFDLILGLLSMLGVYTMRHKSNSRCDVRRNQPTRDDTRKRRVGIGLDIVSK